MLLYCDSSALVKLLRPEPESRRFADFARGGRVVSSQLAFTELSRATRRQAAENPRLKLRDQLLRTEEVLASISLAPIDAEVLAASAALPAPHLRSLDAIHIASALMLDADSFVTYDERQATAASEAGLLVESPV